MNDHANRSPQDKVCGYEYTVRRGDSFYLIANRLGIPLRDLLEANSDINPARLMVGDVLCIPMEEDDAPPEGLQPEVPEPPEVPVPPETPSEPEAPAVPEEMPEEFPGTDEDLDVPAVDGESSCPDGSRYTVVSGETVADVQLRANVNRYTLQRANPSADLERLAAGQVLCVPGESMACPSPVTCILRTDETLESAALRLNTSLAALLRANPCLAPSDFTSGQRIFVPQ